MHMRNNIEIFWFSTKLLTFICCYLSKLLLDVKEKVFSKLCNNMFALSRTVNEHNVFSHNPW
jgi:hypothetical protein